jgi:hypothetical protein
VVAPFGLCTITGYGVEVEFQKATLTGDPKPFLVPAIVIATLTTDKGKIVMRGYYEVKEKK